MAAGVARSSALAMGAGGQPGERAHWPRVVEAVGLALTEGADPNHLVQAAQAYAKQVERGGTEKKYRKSMVRFFADGAWQAFLVRKVHGRTREEWARSGQDVAEWEIGRAHV